MKPDDPKAANDRTKRKFLIGGTVALLAAWLGGWLGGPGRLPGGQPAWAAPPLLKGKKGALPGPRQETAQVALVKGLPRPQAVAQAVALLRPQGLRGKAVLLKPNFNTADPFPASTHNHTLEALILELQKLGAGPITIGERSGPPKTAKVLEQKGIPQLAQKLGVGLINFEALPPEGWVKVKPAHSHWNDGFWVARPVVESPAVVTTCCLKTHGYGGVFTLSLKLSVGLVAKRNMIELHSSFQSMRLMIAEINQAYQPALVVLDGMEAFVDGGPDQGQLRQAGVMVAGTDRVAVDAVGVALLKQLGSNRAIMERPIFAQEQIARAAELGLGIGGPGQIELLPGGPLGGEIAAQLRPILDQG